MAGGALRCLDQLQAAPRAADLAALGGAAGAAAARCVARARPLPETQNLMGWLFILVMALALLIALWRLGNLDKGGLQFVGSALLLALAGYAWQGHPGLAGSPHRPAEHRGVGD